MSPPAAARGKTTAVLLSLIASSLLAGVSARGDWVTGYEMNTAMLPFFEPAEGSIPGLNVDGSLSFLSDDMFYLTIEGLLNVTVDGVPVAMTGAFHLHEKNGKDVGSCEDLGDHLLSNTGEDPWLTTTWTSDENGKVLIDMTVPGFRISDVEGVPVVLHAPDGTSLACNLIKPFEADQWSATVLNLGDYPGYEGESIGGSLIVEVSAAYMRILGTLTDAESSATGEIYLADGTSCDAVDLVGEPAVAYVTSLNPWTDAEVDTTYTTDSVGISFVNVEVFGFPKKDVLGKPLVVTNSDGTPVACGLVVSPYWGYTN